MRKSALVVISLFLALAAGYWFARKDMSAEAPTARAAERVQTVVTAAATKKTLPITIMANGYVTPFQTVDVRPQVQNIVRAVHVKEGQDVRSGQLLFSLDDRVGRSEIDQAQARLARSRADLNEAETALRRNRELLGKGFVSQAVVDTAQSRVNSLRGTLKADEAAIESSRIAAGFNRITASIDGRIGAINVYPGSLAQPTGTPMLTIAQIDPVTVAFSVPERELVNIRASYPAGDAEVSARLADGATLQGTLAFIDNTAEPQSGTIRMKARFDNPQRRLWPGSFVSVSLVSRTIADAVTVPAQAIVNGPTEKFVYVVKPDMTVQQAPVDVLAIVGEQAAITNLAPGIRVVAEGMQNLRAGGKVKESETTAVSGAGMRTAQ